MLKILSKKVIRGCVKIFNFFKICTNVIFILTWKTLKWLFCRISLILLCVFIGFIIGLGLAEQHQELRCDYPQHFTAPPENPDSFNYFKKKLL